MANVTVEFGLDGVGEIGVNLDDSYDFDSFKLLIEELVSVRKAIEKWISS